MADDKDSSLTKKNVQQFDADVKKSGSYQYTGSKLSCLMLNKRISENIASSYPFYNASVLDVGCGDGTYTVEFAALGVKNVLGIDPAHEAVSVAQKRAEFMKLNTIVTFEEENVYTLGDKLEKECFDCIVFRGVLHHLPDPENALLQLKNFKGCVIILEPNGYNPILKMLEKFSSYHVKHEERSFTASTIKTWLKNAGFQTASLTMFNLIPCFCSDSMAKLCGALGPYVEKIPLLRMIACGQLLIVARK